mmetsp:Transcript_40716/g.161383  ORF Transcript_40716/g.161383 Transcript_40716/m.161383 type:complete len:426 (-) Transcript_40716:1384-2661(-)|eukprot:CAMPEP_0113960684 /NCGR_PEP_ID=MMETSP0011_2-20120614/4862_1 /TAXON_ID=101924 /ORGANISM="Rhodosorus marinus" /LENGTH=425 /DNA_ID=CAMNT_0000972185 /DNA_START=57 /DNA_END=1334 /DNA_ORIENTATION=+ /assembly_acc=CAM_ASM_000156
MRVSIGTGGRVAVIGAGAAGLCSAKNLRDFGSSFKVVVFEQDSNVGGTWSYSEKPGSYSVMYKSLRTNIPKEVMAFPGFPFADELPSFPGHSDVQNYLESYMTKMDLRSMIRFNVDVEKVWKDEGGRSWWVKSSDKVNSEVSVEEFDAVVVCNGHHGLPSYASVNGLETFTGITTHSSVYRTPAPFRDQTVVLLGYGPSGVDIAIDIAKGGAKQVLVAHRGYSQDEGPLANISFRPTMVSVEGSTIHFADGRAVDADRIVLCTGYAYNFPFLDPRVGITVKNQVISDLYRHLIFTKDPTLSFVGIPQKIVPFPLFHYQSVYVAKYLSGEVEVPSQEERENEREEEWKNHGDKPDRFFHVFGQRQWEYMYSLAQQTEQTPMPRALQSVFENAREVRTSNPVSYRARQYEVFGEEETDWSYMLVDPV